MLFGEIHIFSKRRASLRNASSLLLHECYGKSDQYYIVSVENVDINSAKKHFSKISADESNVRTFVHKEQRFIMTGDFEIIVIDGLDIRSFKLNKIGKTFLTVILVYFSIFNGRFSQFLP